MVFVPVAADLMDPEASNPLLARGHQSDPCLPHNLGPSQNRRGERRGQRCPRQERSRGIRSIPRPQARGPGDRAQALPRPLRDVREGQAGHAAAQGDAAATLSEFLLRSGNALFEAAKRQGFTWSVHRSHTTIGYSIGTSNMGVTLATYATICRETGRPFVFPGSIQQWEGLTDVTDARVLAKHLEWAATSEAGRNQAFNIVNGDIFRWRWLWPRLAADFGIEAAGYPSKRRPLEPELADKGPIWADIAAKHRLVERDLSKLQSAWHTDADTRAGDRSRDRHDEEPPGRLPRLSADTGFVPGRVCPIAARADHPGVRLGPRRCRDTNTVRECLYKNFVPFTWFDTETEAGRQMFGTVRSPSKTLEKERGTRQDDAADWPVRKAIDRESQA